MDYNYTVYSDGAYSIQREQGGIAFVILNNANEKIAEYSKTFLKSTSQRMEQLAAIIALESIKTPSDIKLFTDSQYVVCTYTKNWKRKANLDLWERFDKIIAFHNSVDFEHVKGHAGDKHNEYVDTLAFNASKVIIKQ